MKNTSMIAEYLSVTEEDVKKILRSKDGFIKNIFEKIDTINREILNTKDLIAMVSLTRPKLSDMPKGEVTYKDIGDTYAKYQITLENRNDAYAEFLEALIAEEKSIHRIWLCFLALEEPYYGILKRLYVEHELYATVEAESGVSRQVFEKKRKKAIAMIIRLYESSEPDANLITMRKMIERENLKTRGAL